MNSHMKKKEVEEVGVANGGEVPATPAGHGGNNLQVKRKTSPNISKASHSRSSQFRQVIGGTEAAQTPRKQ